MEQPFLKNEDVEILCLWAFGEEPAWMRGYAFDHYEPSGDCIVLHRDGPFEGAPVRMPAAKVRRAQR